MLNPEVSRIIQSRMSVYPTLFTGEKIDKEVVEELIQNANTAPTHRLTQPWLFKVFGGSSKQGLLEEIFRLNPAYDDIKKERLQYKFDKSSHILCIVMKRHEDKVPEWEEIAATAMAVQNLWISCVDSNLGGYWSSPKYSEDLHGFLCLESDERCLGFFYLGKYDASTPLKRDTSRRATVESKVEWM